MGQEDLRKGGGKSTTKPQGNNIPFSSEKQVGVIRVYKGIALREWFKGIAFKERTGLWECPTRLPVRDKTSQD